MGKEAGSNEPLDASSVQISKAVVSIKVVTVDRKQMTLAVFRQLPQVSASYWDACDDREEAEPWGTVNYHSDCRPEHRLNSHLHLLWQAGDNLYRSIIMEPVLHSYLRDGLRSMGMLGIEHIFSRGDIWWEDDDLDLAGAAYGSLLRLDQLFIAV